MQSKKPTCWTKISGQSVPLFVWKFTTKGNERGTCKGPSQRDWHNISFFKYISNKYKIQYILFYYIILLLLRVFFRETVFTHSSSYASWPTEKQLVWNFKYEICILVHIQFIINNINILNALFIRSRLRN